MVSALTEVVISLMDLAKAELRQGRDGLVRLGVTVALALAAVMLGAIGVVLLLAAILVGLMQTLSTPTAFGITAAVSLLFAAGLGWVVKDLLDRS